MWLLLAAVCGGGVLPGNCMIRTKTAAIEGSKSFLANVLLNPANFTDLPYDDLVDSVTDSASGGD